MPFNMDLLAHMRAVTACLPRFDARVELRSHSLQLEVRARGRYYDLLPQYAVLKGGRIRYMPHLTPEATYFIGWRHYFNRQWELSNDKTAFKRYCNDVGLRTPRMFMNAQEIDSDVLIKHTRSSFGEGIDGPFRRADARALNRLLRDGEYFEEFVVGDIAKIWYWDGNLVSLEVKPMASVRGDGKHDLRQLINARKSPFLRVDEPSMEALVHYQGMSLDSILPVDGTALIDFRYMSGLNPATLTNQNVLSKYSCEAALEQMRVAGPLFWRGIPEGTRDKTLFTIDAIVDRNQQVYYLEMNSNPVVHPDSYMAMFEGFFGPPVSLPDPSTRVPQSATEPTSAPLPVYGPPPPVATPGAAAYAPEPGNGSTRSRWPT